MKISWSFIRHPPKTQDKCVWSLWHGTGLWHWHTQWNWHRQSVHPRHPSPVTLWLHLTRFWPTRGADSSAGLFSFNRLPKFPKPNAFQMDTSVYFSPTLESQLSFQHALINTLPVNWANTIMLTISWRSYPMVWATPPHRSPIRRQGSPRMPIEWYALGGMSIFVGLGITDGVYVPSSP